MITEEQVESALHFLATSAAQHAQATGAIVYLEYKIKRIKALAFLQAEGTIAERQAHAETTEEVKQAVDEYRDAVTTERLLRDQRMAAELRIAVWQTQSANARVRNV